MTNCETHIEHSTLQERLADLLTADQETFIRAWLTGSILPASSSGTDTYEAYAAQARRLLALLASGLRCPPETSRPFTPEIDAALQRQFPLVYRVQALLMLASALSVAYHERWQVEISPRVFFEIIQELFAALPIEPSGQHWFTERLGKLNQISWSLNSIHHGDTIIRHTVEDAPSLVDAESAAVWLWDADQRVPVLLVTGKELSAQFPMPDSFLRLLRQACDCRCAFSVDAGESDGDWPAGMAGHPVAFIPLQAQQDCIGVLTVHHQLDARFSHDDILLLSSLGNIAATALLNVQLHTSERHLVNLLQSSIRQVVHVVSSGMGPHEEFTQSMLQVAEGLTRAEAVCAVLEVEGRAGELITLTGSLALTHADALRQLAGMLRTRVGDADIPKSGTLRRIIEAGEFDHALRRQSYAYVPVACHGQPAGILFALSPTAFHQDQTTFLEMIAEQIGVGLESMQRSAGMQRLLVELANVNYVSQAITHTFDQQRILTLINQAASQAVAAPIALSGWYEDDGVFHIRPGTAIGLTPEEVRKVRLTAHNAIFKMVIDTRSPVTPEHFTKGRKAAFPLPPQKGIRSWICIPMIAASQGEGVTSPQVLGVLMLADTQERHFSEREIALLSTYANQGALAMANSILYEQVEEQLRQIRLLYENLSAMTATLDLSVIVQTLLQSTTQALQLPAGLVTLAKKAGGVQQVAASHGIDDVQLEHARFRAGEGIVGLVYQHGEPIESSNLASDGRCAILSDMARREGLVSSYTVPLMVPGHRWGTLTVCAREMHGFTAAEKHLLGTMATQGAVAIQNARAFAGEREHAAELDQLLMRLSRRLPEALELVRRCLEVSRDTEEKATQMPLALARVQCLASLGENAAEQPTPDIDVKEALLAVFHHPRCFPPHFSTSQVVLSGASLVLPTREAMALILYLQEWIRAASAQGNATSQPSLAVSFLSAGKEIVVQLSITPLVEGTPLAVNEDLLMMAVEVLHGTMTVTSEATTRQIRLRFPSPLGC